MLSNKRTPSFRGETKSVGYETPYDAEEMSQEVPFLKCLLNPFGEGGYIPDTKLIPRILKDQRYSKTLSGQSTYLFKITGHNKDVQIRVYIPTGFAPNALYPSDWVLLMTIDPDELLSDSYSADRPVAFGCSIRSGTQPVGVFTLSGTVDAVYTRIAPDTRFLTTSNISVYRQDATSVMTAGLLGDGVTVIFDAPEDDRFTPTDTSITRTITDAKYNALFTMGVIDGDRTGSGPTQPEFKFPNVTGQFFLANCSLNGSGRLPYPLEGRTYIKANGQFTATSAFITTPSAWPLVLATVITEDGQVQLFQATVNCQNPTTGGTFKSDKPLTSSNLFKRKLLERKTKSKTSSDEDFDIIPVKTEKKKRIIEKKIKEEEEKLDAPPAGDYVVWSFELDIYVDSTAPIMSINLTGSSGSASITQAFMNFNDAEKLCVQISNENIYGTGYNDPCALVLLSGVDDAQDIVVKGCKWNEAIPNPELLKNLKVSYPRGLNITDLDHVRAALCRYEEAGYGRIWTSVDYAAFQLSSTIRQLAVRSTMVGAALDWRTMGRRALGWLGNYLVKPALKAGISSMVGGIPALGAGLISGLNDVSFGYSAPKVPKLTAMNKIARLQYYKRTLRKLGYEDDEKLKGSIEFVINSDYDFLKDTLLFSVGTKQRKQIDSVLAEQTHSPVRKMRSLPLRQILQLCSDCMIGEKVAKFMHLPGYTKDFRLLIPVGSASSVEGEMKALATEQEAVIPVGGTVDEDKNWVQYLNPQLTNSILKPAFKTFNPVVVDLLPFRAQKFIYITAGQAYSSHIMISVKPFKYHYNHNNGILGRGAIVKYNQIDNHYVDQNLTDKEGQNLSFLLLKYFGFDEVYVTCMTDTPMVGTSYLMALWAACYGVPMGTYFSGTIDNLNEDGITFGAVGDSKLKIEFALRNKGVIILCEAKGEESVQTERFIATRHLFAPENITSKVMSIKSASSILFLMTMVYENLLTQDERAKMLDFLRTKMPDLKQDLQERVRVSLESKTLSPAQLTGLVGAVKGVVSPNPKKSLRMLDPEFRTSITLGGKRYEFDAKQINMIGQKIDSAPIIYPDTYQLRKIPGEIKENMVGFLINYAFTHYRQWFDTTFVPIQILVPPSKKTPEAKAAREAKHRERMLEQQRASEEKKAKNLEKQQFLAGTGKKKKKKKKGYVLETVEEEKETKMREPLAEVQLAQPSEIPQYSGLETTQF